VLAGDVIGILADDFFRKTGLKALARPIAGALFWAGIALCWLLLIARLALDFWTKRVPYLDVDRGDSIWFAYITSLTIGLGDYFLVRTSYSRDDVIGTYKLNGYAMLILFVK
jgi:Ion channel